MLQKDNSFEKIINLLKTIEASPEWILFDSSEILGGMGEDDVDCGYQFYNEEKDQALSFVINYKYKKAYMKKISKKELNFYSKEKAINFMLSNKNTKTKTKRKEAVVALLKQVEQNSEWELIDTTAFRSNDEPESVEIKTRYYNKVTKEAVEFSINEKSRKASYKTCQLSGFNIFDDEEIELQTGKKM